jgi:hypothetical protein
MQPTLLMIPSAAAACLERLKAVATEEQRKIRTRLVGNKFRPVPDDDEPSAAKPPLTLQQSNPASESNTEQNRNENITTESDSDNPDESQTTEPKQKPYKYMRQISYKSKKVRNLLFQDSGIPNNEESATVLPASNEWYISPPQVVFHHIKSFKLKLMKDTAQHYIDKCLRNKQTIQSQLEEEEQQNTSKDDEDSSDDDDIPLIRVKEKIRVLSRTKTIKTTLNPRKIKVVLPCNPFLSLIVH